MFPKLRHGVVAMDLNELTDLEILPLRIVAYAREDILLPEQSGSTLRGAFGQALYDLVCVHREREQCPGCTAAASCAYSTLFEPRSPEGAPGFSGVGDLPRPFVVRGPNDGHCISAGEEWNWQVTLIGKGIRQLPYFVLAWREMGDRGLGRGRGRFDLQRVEHLDLRGGPAGTVFDGATGRLVSPEAPTLPETWPTERVTVRFLTPTVLKQERRTLIEPQFGVLWRAVQLRLSLLRLAHGQGRPHIDFKGSIQASGSVRLVSWEGRRMAWLRYSNRQQQRVPMHGLVGEAVYEGDLAAFVPALRLGSWVGVGDNCTFGQGYYVLASSEAD